MPIDSADYYQILISEEFRVAGEQFIQELSEKTGYGPEISAYSLDIRCLIGYALSHDNVEFDIGGMCHVIGHNIQGAIGLISGIASEHEHPQAGKISRLFKAMSH